MMGNKWALQGGTSHFLGQHFAKVFNIQFLDETNQLQMVWQTSWAVTTRLVGALVMVHGDDQGLRLPPRLAPIQVVVVPIWKSDEERSQVMPVVERITGELSKHVRLHVDDRTDLSPGFKFNDWELRGVPLRLELDPRTYRRARPCWPGVTCPPGRTNRRGARRTAARSTETAVDIQSNLFNQALRFREENTYYAGHV